MSHPLAEDYLRWLEPQIRDEYSGNPSRTYWELLGLMLIKEYVWTVPNDDNRMVDGLDLRVEFCYVQHIRSDALSDLGGCSFLEVLIGISRRLAFSAGGQAPTWAWQLLNNLELHRLGDPMAWRHRRRADDIMEAVIWRKYSPDGMGGFFPLVSAEEDQTEVEVWYQMAAYIDELHPEY